MRRAGAWAVAGTASFAGVLLLVVATARLGPTGAAECAAQQKSDIATMQRVVTPLLPKPDRELMTPTTGCAAEDPAAISWDTTRPAEETFTSLARAGWTRLPDPQARFVTDGYYRLVGRGYVTVTYLATNSAFRASTVAP